MHNKLWSKLMVATVGWVAAGLGHAQREAGAEEIWSQNFCEQAVSMAKERGESPEALNLVDCRLLNYYQPSYWQCVIETMKANSILKLDAARQTCLADY